GLQIAMSIGSPVRNILSCSKSFREASKVFFVAQNNNASSPTFWEEMGIYKILAPIHDSPEAEDFITEYLGALIKISKQQTKDSLLETLFCIVRSNWQLKPVAAAMNLHYNTVKYRYQKLSEILGLDMDLSSTRINLTLAMELYMLNRFRKENGSWEE
ncbi:MAG: helix-turn-helix domain-containing protein, partial [Cloacibacillus sp.]